jgi:hypothetical protein
VAIREKRRASVCCKDGLLSAAPFVFLLHRLVAGCLVLGLGRQFSAFLGRGIVGAGALARLFSEVGQTGLSIAGKSDVGAIVQAKG